MIIVECSAFAQMEVKKKSNLLLTLQPSFYIKKFTGIIKPSASTPIKIPFLNPDFYSKQAGFFCRQEIKMDKFLKVSFRFRLGSVEQCDWLEGKRK